MKTLREILRQPGVAGTLLSLLTLGAVLAVRAGGGLQRAELAVYDQGVRWRAASNSTTLADPHIVICGMTEEDLVKYGHPLNDAKLAELLEKIVAQQPCVVGLDIYRDLKEPRSGELYPRLAETLTRLEQVIAIQRIPDIAAPAALADHPDRVAPNNIPTDRAIDGIFRRAYVTFESGLAEPTESFAFALAHTYLASQKVEVKLFESPQGTPLIQLGQAVLPRLAPDTGGYVGLEVRDYELLIDYRGPQHFRTVSFGDVLEDRLSPGALRDTIVLVGVVAESVKDSNPTPVDGRLRGVVQQAMITDQFLRTAQEGESATTAWPEGIEILWIALGTFAGGGIGLWLASPWKLAPALVLLLAVIGLTAWETLKHALWIPAVAPALGAVGAATLGISFVAYLERAERGILQTLFSRHVSPEVARALWDARGQFLEGGRLKPQKLMATVLFTDLKGFSTISEGMEPDELMEWMNEYTNGVARHVDLHGGLVSAYIGDAIMAVFGVPVAHTRPEEIDRDAVRAVECALAMRRELASLNRDWKARGLPTVAMRVGIYTGPLVAGSIGSAQRLDFTVLGDTANIAARLENAGKEIESESDPEAALCTILIGDATWQRLGGRFQTRLIGPMNLKGKTAQIIVHSVLSQKASAPDL